MPYSLVAGTLTSKTLLLWNWLPEGSVAIAPSPLMGASESGSSTFVGPSVDIHAFGLADHVTSVADVT